MKELDPRRIGSALAAGLSFRRIGVIYVWIAIAVLFCILSPSIFMRSPTIPAIVNGYSIYALASLAILVPLVAGTYDVSIGGNISLTSVLCVALLLHTSLSVPLVIIITLLAGVALGLINALVVVALRVPSLIGTLAIGGIADALSVGISGNQTLSSPRVAGAFSNDLSQINWHGYTIAFLFVIVLAVVIDVILRTTVTGRYSYAVGFDPEVSRLAGIRVKRVQTASLAISGLIGAFAGLVLSAHVASATPNAGDSYLLPAFAAVFVGSTQWKAHRFNAAGTVIAVLMLGTGEYGLVIVGAPTWMPDAFQGVALIAAIAVTHLTLSRRGSDELADDPVQGEPAAVLMEREPLPAFEKPS